jgi:bifunctional non-homologous end joining protein LigD
MLPELAPMLAVPAAPFDSAAYVFAVKWDGVRALAALERHGWRLWGRQQTAYTALYPELEVLRRWPTGTLLDGELITLQAGRPCLAALRRRHALTAPLQIRWARRWCPVHFVVFDLLYDRGRALLRQPLAQRRQRLAELCAAVPVPGVVFSAGVVGPGRAFYQAVLAAGHEGVMAKLRTAPYRPGRRALSWRKIKPGRRLAERCSVP